MKKIVVDMQNFLFADSIATAFKNSDYDIAVVRAESPRDTIELCRVFKPFVLLMEVTAYIIAFLRCRFGKETSAGQYRPVRNLEAFPLMRYNNGQQLLYTDLSRFSPGLRPEPKNIAYDAIPFRCMVS